MKINWGTGLVIGMILFVGFIMFFVIKISTDKKYDYDLVTEEYYKRELVYQKEIDAAANSNSLLENISGAKTNDGWVLTFPGNLDYSKIKGNVLFYRPSNKKLDFQEPIQLSAQNLLIPDARLIPGRWNTIVQWNYDGEDYLYKEEIVY
ncbi:FixH family protein [Aequorivita sp. SDUM287046]|uniref:FixH family protein n=1 Tax=Aequorivita aurantiaca TaxID=3053356 RepID=A0ABT8DFP0_9FLAO|nr:FixH family protein [Aequorivita aurantiaca]MDN3724171.1 FixH family protein [Aequorivita aurantiaca]